jgi:hypothetical protein
VRSAGARSEGQVSGGMLLATTWRNQTREAARSLTSAAEAEASMTAPESLRNACWRGLEVGSGRLAFAQTATKFARGHIVETTIRDDVLGEMDTKIRSRGLLTCKQGSTLAQIRNKKAGVHTRNELDHTRDPEVIACCIQMCRAVGESSSKKPARESQCRLRLFEMFQGRVGPRMACPVWLRLSCCLDRC